MGYNKMNQSHGLLYDETMFLTYQKVPKVKITCSYSKEGVSKFLLFKSANRHFKNSHVYKKCQIRLLEEEVKSKRKRINTLEKDRERVKEELQRKLPGLDFSYICS